jgi:hypothetical protein
LNIPQAQHLSLEFIDDIVFGMQGLTGAGNVERLQGMLEKTDRFENKVGWRCVF